MRDKIGTSPIIDEQRPSLILFKFLLSIEACRVGVILSLFFCFFFCFCRSLYSFLSGWTGVPEHHRSSIQEVVLKDTSKLIADG